MWKIGVDEDVLTLVLLLFWAKYFCVVGAVLCIQGCLAAFLVSTHQMLVAPSSGVTTKNISRRCHMTQGGVKLCPVENYQSRPAFATFRSHEAPLPSDDKYGPSSQNDAQTYSSNLHTISSLS